MSTRIGDLLKEGLSRGIEGLCVFQLGISIVKKPKFNLTSSDGEQKACQLRLNSYLLVY
jgi:hypothetical protein